MNKAGDKEVPGREGKFLSKYFGGESTLKGVVPELLNLGGICQIFIERIKDSLAKNNGLYFIEAQYNNGSFNRAYLFGASEKCLNGQLQNSDAHGLIW